MHTIVAGGGSSLYEERRRSMKVDSIRELSAPFRVPASLFPLLFPFVPFVPYTLHLYENVRKTAFFPKKKNKFLTTRRIFLSGEFVRRGQKNTEAGIFCCRCAVLKIFVLLIRQKTRENLGSEEMSPLFIIVFFLGGRGGKRISLCSLSGNHP